MSCASPRTVARTMETLAAVRLLVHVRFEERHRGLHGLGRLQHEGQLHLPAPNRSPTVFIPSKRISLTMSRGRWVSMASSRSSSIPAAIAVDDSKRGDPRLSLGFPRRPFPSFSAFSKTPSAVRAAGHGTFAAAVEDQVFREAARVLVDLVRRDDAADVDDGRINPRSRVVQEPTRSSRSPPRKLLPGHSSLSLSRLKPPKPEGISLPVELDDLIRSVVVAPEAQPWLYDIVADLSDRYGLKSPIRRSKLTYLPKMNLTFCSSRHRETPQALAVPSWAGAAQQSVMHRMRSTYITAKKFLIRRASATARCGNRGKLSGAARSK